MIDVSPRISPESVGRRGDGRGHQNDPPAMERSAEDRSFATLEPTVDLIAPHPLTVGAGFELEHELVQASQEAVRVGQRAFSDAMDIWRRSWLEPFAVARVTMGGWYEDALRQMTGFGTVQPLRTSRPSAGGAFAALVGAPAIDLKELDEAYRLDIEVPGLEAEDLDLSLKDDLLVIRGLKAESLEDAGAYRISERRYGRFERAVPLPDHTDRRRIDTRLERGVLRITLPKTSSTAHLREKVPIHG